jgi:hypothetical protein
MTEKTNIMTKEEEEELEALVRQRRFTSYSILQLLKLSYIAFFFASTSI